MDGRVKIILEAIDRRLTVWRILKKTGKAVHVGL
jgi:hypothetical protein